jgi:hypothetical protein
MNSTDCRPAFFVRHPWLFVVFAFLLLITAWSTLIMVAMKHSPQTIEATAK